MSLLKVGVLGLLGLVVGAGPVQNSEYSISSGGGASARSKAPAQPTAANAPLSSSVLAIVLGDRFLLDGSAMPSNANLFDGTRLQTQETAVSVFMHDKCEFLVGPHSTVVFSEGQVHVESGSVRAKHFGNCKMGYAALWVAGVGPNADGVLSISGTSMEVTSTTGQLQVANTAGEVLSTVSPGSMATFGPAPTTSGATAGIVRPSRKAAYILIGTGVAASLAGLGLAVDSAFQSSPTSR